MRQTTRCYPLMNILCYNERTICCVIFRLGPARLPKVFTLHHAVNIVKPCGGTVLHDPTKIGHAQRGRRIGKDTFPKASQHYQVFFLNACNGHQVGLDLDGGIGRKSQLQPNSVWSWLFHMQSTNKLPSIFQRI